MKVAIVRGDGAEDGVQEAIGLCGGLESLRTDSKVMIKPNLSSGAKRNFSPFGVVTTSTVVEAIVRLLQRRGCKDIAIGDGSVILKEMGTNTRRAFKFSGVERVARDHGVRLVDFDKGPFKEIRLDGDSFLACREALDADFLINAPVLKTHGGTVVSLGTKNLKGCLKFTSKKGFHLIDLERYVALLSERLRSHLVVIDGTYAMERGPSFGTAHRKDLLIAGTDVLAVDVVGAAVLGKEPAAVGHINELAALRGGSPDPGSVEVVGERVEDVACDLPWKWDLHAYFRRFGVKGIKVTCPDPPVSVCSQCYGILETSHLLFSKDNPGLEADDLEVCVGRGAPASGESRKALLFGDCAIESNRGLENATRVGGCPPRISRYLPLLMKETVGRARAAPVLLGRSLKMVAYWLGVYHEDCGLLDPYRPPEFDIGDYR